MGIFDDDNDKCLRCQADLAEPGDMICEDCDREAQEQNQNYEHEQLERSMARRGKFWKEICPEDYRTGAISKMHGTLQETYKNWNPEHGRNLLIVGESGAGKTTAALLFAKAAHFKGVAVRFHDASDLRQEAIKASTSEEGFKKFKNRFLKAELIVIDDLGNTANTQSSDEHLRSLLEGIRSRGIRTIITTQYPSQKLIARYSSQEFGEAVVRRICHQADVAVLRPEEPQQQNNNP